MISWFPLRAVLLSFLKRRLASLPKSPWTIRDEWGPGLALYTAIARDDVHAVAKALQRGATVHCCCVLEHGRYRTPSELAIERGNTQVLETLNLRLRP